MTAQSPKQSQLQAIGCACVLVLYTGSATSENAAVPIKLCFLSLPQSSIFRGLALRITLHCAVGPMELTRKCADDNFNKQS